MVDDEGGIVGVSSREGGEEVVIGVIVRVVWPGDGRKAQYVLLCVLFVVDGHGNVRGKFRATASCGGDGGRREGERGHQHKRRDILGALS